MRHLIAFLTICASVLSDGKLKPLLNQSIDGTLFSGQKPPAFRVGVQRFRVLFEFLNRVEFRIHRDRNEPGVGCRREFLHPSHLHVHTFALTGATGEDETDYRGVAEQISMRDIATTAFRQGEFR